MVSIEENVIDPGLLMLLIMLRLGQIEEKKHEQTPYYKKTNEQKHVQKRKGKAKRIIH